MEELIHTIHGFLGGAVWYPYVILGVGLFFTLYLKFPQVRFFAHATRVLRGKYSTGNEKGDTTPFQALTTALSGTVGTGNIGGVGLALYLGGPAALFWMWATAFVGMTTKFVEVTLSHKYRIKTDDGTIAGGPMFVMERALNMKWLAVIFAIAIIISTFCAGNMPQINSIAAAQEEAFNIPRVVTGAVLSIILGLVIIGGIKRIAQVTEKIVPFMAVLYIVGALGVIFANVENILPSFYAIFADIFSGTAATGGFLGASFAYLFNNGVGRGLFSNEAGQGSAPIAHASAKTEESLEEGMVSILEPFIDTIIICTITGLVILSSGVWMEKYQNDFQDSDMVFLVGNYSDNKKEDTDKLYAYLNNIDENAVETFDGNLKVLAGAAVSPNFTLISSRSIAEDVRYTLDGQPYTGDIKIVDGEIDRGQFEDKTLVVSGKSRLHGVLLTTKAFTKGFFGDYGEFIIALGLLLFAFSTAIAWSYYGDRAVIYLVGQQGVLPYRILYISVFFMAAIIDTSVVWSMADVAVALTTLPNLFALMLLHRDMRDNVTDYWAKFRAKT